MTYRVKKRILIVTDEPVIGMLLSEALSGYFVDTNWDIVDAVKEFDSPSKYDLIILDINMPKIDGITFLRNITKGFPELKNKLLFITGDPTEDELSFFKENNYHHLTKPFKGAVAILAHVKSILKSEEKGFATEDAVWKQANRRSEERYPSSVDCQVFHKGKYHLMPLSAKTLDISQHGANIRYIGEPFNSGETVNIHIISLNLRRDAIVQWSKNIRELNTSSGLRFIEQQM